MKLNKKILIAAVVCTIVGGIITAASTAVMYDASMENVRTVTKTAETDISKISLSADAGNIKVISSDTDEVTLTYSEDDTTRYTVVEENGMLSVSPEKISRSKAEWYDYYFSIDFHSNDITLSIPSDFFAETEIRTDLGNVDISGLNGVLTAESDYGNIKITGGEFSKLELNVDCGNIEFKDISGDDIYMESDLGDIRGTIAGKYSDYSIWAEAEVGHCNLLRSADGPKHLAAHANVGDINIHFEP